MIAFVVRRLLHGLLAITVLIVVVFFATHTLGDPVRLMLPIGASQEAVEATRERFGLNDPVIIQFGNYVKDIVRLDFGVSLWQRRPCMDLVIERLPATALLALVAMAWAVLAGILFGVLAGTRPRSKTDRSVSFVTFIGASSIDFWVALMLIIVASVKLGWFPTSGYGGFKYLILPAITLGFRPFGRIAQVTRPVVVEEFNKPYIMALRARGLCRLRIIGHALRNASVVIFTLTGYEFARLFTGASVVVEAVFGWPGVGLLMIQSIQRRDWPLIVATTTVVAGIVIILHILIDLIYGLINPRVRFE